MKHIIPSKVLLLCIVSLFFASCDKNDQDGTEEEVKFNRTGNELILRTIGGPDRLNPLLTLRNDSKIILYQTHSYLLFPDLETYKMVPQLAKSEPIVEEVTEGPDAGNIKYTFEIHENATWDNGSPVTAEDVIFTWKAVLFPGLAFAEAYREYLFFLKDVVIDPQNPKKFTVITNEKYFIALESLGALMFIMPEYHYDPNALLKDIPFNKFTNRADIEAIVEQSEALKAFPKSMQDPKFTHEPSGISGSGPYKLTKWEQGQEIVLEKKEDWWGNELGDQFESLEAYPDRIVIKPIPSGATALAALKAEEIDVVPRIDPKDFKEIQDDTWIKERYNLVEKPMLQVFLLYINNQSPKLNDKLVRQALAHAMDVDSYIKNIYYGYGQRTASYPFPEYDYYNDELPIIRYDPEKAKGLLAEAGWTDSNSNGILDKNINGELVELNLRVDFVANRETTRNIMELMQSTMKTVGINLEFAPKDVNQLGSDLRSGNFELTSSGSTIQFIPWEPNQSIHSNGANGGNNYSRFMNEEADKLIDEIRFTIDEAKRNELYKKLQAVIYEEQPLIYFFNPINRTAIHKRFEGKMTAISPGIFPNHFQLKESFRK